MLDVAISEGKTKIVLLRNFLFYKWYVLLAWLNKKNFSLNPEADFVISIASYPKRIHLLPAVFEALAKQTVKPQKMILVLSEEEWPGCNVPPNIEKLVDRGVEIIWTKNNTYAVKKLVPVIEKYPDLAVITLDDDLLYRKNVIEKLTRVAQNKKGCIIGHIGKELYRSGDKLNMLYRTRNPASMSTNSAEVYLLGGSGTLYPSNSLDSRVTNLQAIKEIVPGRGSDIWFWAAAHAKGTNQICIGTKSDKNLYIPIPQNNQTKPKDKPGKIEMEKRFQKAIDYFGIREKLLVILPDNTKLDNYSIGSDKNLLS